MHPRAICCRICGKKFFPASLPFHLKACEERHRSTLLDQAEGDSQAEEKWDDMLRNCRVDSKLVISKAYLEPGRSKSLPFRAGTTKRLGFSKCTYCGRNFSFARINAHMEMCKKFTRNRTFHNTSSQTGSWFEKMSCKRPDSKTRHRKHSRAQTPSYSSMLSRSAEYTSTSLRDYFGWVKDTHNVATPSRAPAAGAVPFTKYELKNTKNGKNRSSMHRPMTMGSTNQLRMGSLKQSNFKGMFKIPKKRTVKNEFLVSPASPPVQLNSRAYSRGWSRGSTALSRSLPSKPPVAFSRGLSRKGQHSRFDPHSSTTSVQDHSCGVDPSNATNVYNPLRTSIWQAMPH